MSVFANRNAKGDFIINELERWSTSGLDVYIASAFFTDSELVERLLLRGCKVYMVVRLGFPTSPSAIDRVSKHTNLHLRIYTGHSYHPKLYILGNEFALVGSANLTRAALMTNQEVVVRIDSSDDRLVELFSIFEDYWEGAEVPTSAQLATYRELYKKFSSLDGAMDALGREVLGKLGSSAPRNIDRGRQHVSRQSLFASSFRRTYQECVSAFHIVREVYEESAYRKVGEDRIPLRLEIDSFISFIRETVAVGDSWSSAPIRSLAQQEAVILPLIEKWKNAAWPHFEDRIVEVNYPRFNKVFQSEESIFDSSDSELFDALATLHSFHDRFRFFEGGLGTWKRVFPTFNDGGRTRETLAYLVHGKEDIVERMANALYSPRYKLNSFGQANVQELVGWCNQQGLPIINGRTTKVLRYLGSKVRQL